MIIQRDNKHLRELNWNNGKCLFLTESLSWVLDFVAGYCEIPSG